jgi:hypothetical protein
MTRSVCAFTSWPTWSASRANCSAAFRISFPAASSSAWALPAPSRLTQNY